MRHVMVLTWMLAGLSIMASVGEADEVGELKMQIAEQSRVLGQMQQRLSNFEAQQANQRQVLDQYLSELPDGQAGAGDSSLLEKLAWLEHVKLYGDLRYRHESIDAERDGDWQTGRSRHRIRARLGLKAAINEEWSVDFRLAGGSSDPVSTNQTLGDSFSTKDIRLDKAYMKYQPSAIKGLAVLGGKMGNPFFNVGKNQLIWDGDLTPEGIAATYTCKLADDLSLFANGGGFWAEESGSDVDASLWGVQAGVKHKLSDDCSVTGGVSYYDFGNVEGRGLLANGGDSFGNTTELVAGQDVYAGDFDILELFGEVAGKVRGMPVAVYGNYVNNCSATTSQDQGWLLGCQINKAKDVGSWEAGYNYRDLEADAVIGAFSDSDFIGGGTNGKGHQLQGKYQLAKNVQTAVTYFINEAGNDADDYRRLQADIILTF